MICRSFSKNKTVEKSKAIAKTQNTTIQISCTYTPMYISFRFVVVLASTLLVTSKQVDGDYRVVFL